MKDKGYQRHPARVIMHLPGGYTRVTLSHHLEGSHCWDIPTAKIPLHLRALGSRMMVTARMFKAENEDAAHLWRAAIDDIVVEEFSE